MRTHLRAGVLAILVAGSLAAAQAQPKQPGRASVPSGPIFRGGFGRPIVINSSPPQNNPPAASPANAGPQNAPPTARPSPRPTPGQAQLAERDQHADHDHADHNHGGCTGDCQHDAPASIALPGDETGDQVFPPGTPAADLIARLQPPAPTLRSDTKSDAYCAKCHPNGVPQSASAAGERGSPSRDLRLRNPFNDPFSDRTNDRGVASGAIRSGHGPDPQLAAVLVSQASSPHEPVRAEDGPPVALVGSAPAQAESALRTWLKDNPGDFAVMRALAVAQLCLSRADDAAGTMLEAYRSDPLLSREPIDSRAMGLDAQKLLRLANTAATEARKADTARAWLLASVVYQVQGSKPRALDALSLAKKNGLDADLADWLKVSLSGPPAREPAASK